MNTGVAAVLGPTGGTNAVHVAARYGARRWSSGVRLPFAVYRTQDGRSADLGNVMVDLQALVETNGAVHGLGVEAHVNLGGRPYTWAHRAEEIWPGGGVDGVWQVRTTGDLAWLGRASLGLHGTRGYHPFPAMWFRAGVAGGVDWTATPALGVTAEASAAWWEVSPLELSGMVRLQPTSGMRLRLGALLPVSAWAGATPTALPAGVSEVTLLTDLTFSM